MSRLGKQPITIPSGVSVTVADGVVTVKGPKGELSREVRDQDISIEVADGKVTLTPKRSTILARALWGTYVSHLRNMIKGVEVPFEKKLIVEGIGYRGEVSGKDMVFSLGFSHPVRITIPEGLTAKVEKELVTITGIDKELVGAFSAKIRSFRPPEPYKGKGIRYQGEVILRKQGKRAAATA